MIDNPQQDAPSFCLRPIPPVALAACALIAVTTLLTAPAFAAPEPKIEICHRPPGNPDNWHTITISGNALAAHLAHGDKEGSCNEICDELCTDNDACTMDHGGNCEEEGCLPVDERPRVDCDDSNECTVDSCDPVDGMCDNVADVGKSCNEEKFCPFSCDADAICQPVDSECCDSDDDCGAEYCNGNFCGIDHKCASTGYPCGDNVQCTADMCFNDTGCQYEPVDELCDDYISCTVDLCDPQLGCHHLPDDELCDDGITCTINEFCDPMTGCGSTADDSLCDDGIACTSEVCDPNTGCISTAHDSLCDDGNRCTTDKCDPSAGGCRNDPGPVPNCCNSDDECPTGEQCNDDPSDPTCQPICVTAFDYQGTGNILGFISDCQQGCPDPTICYESPTVTDCVYGGDPAACEQVNNVGLSYGCHICPPPIQQDDLLVCGGGGCYRHNANTGVLVEEFTLPDGTGCGDTPHHVLFNTVDDTFWMYNIRNALSQPRSEICVYDDQGAVIHHFNLPEPCDPAGCTFDQFNQRPAFAIRDWTSTPQGEVYAVANGTCRDLGTNVCQGYGTYMWRVSPPSATETLVINADPDCGGRPVVFTADPFVSSEHAFAISSVSGETQLIRMEMGTTTPACTPVSVLFDPTNASPELRESVVNGTRRLRIAPDGTFYFLAVEGNYGSLRDEGIWRVPATGGAPTQVLAMCDLVNPVPGGTCTTSQSWLNKPIIDFAIHPVTGNLYVLEKADWPNSRRIRIYDAAGVSQGILREFAEQRNVIEFFPTN